MKTTEIKREFQHRVGNYYRHINGDIYMLCTPEIGKVNLMSINNGVRFYESLNVINLYSITDSEFNELTYNHSNDFTNITIKEIIYEI